MLGNDITAMEEEDSPISQVAFHTQVAPVAWRGPLREITNTNVQAAKQMPRSRADLMRMFEKESEALREQPLSRCLPGSNLEGPMPKVVERTMSKSPTNEIIPERALAQASHTLDEASQTPMASRRESGERTKTNTASIAGSESRDFAGVGAARDVAPKDVAIQTCYTVKQTAEVPQMPPSTKAHFHIWRQEAMAGRYVRRRASRIPKDQAELLDSRDCWQPAAPGRDTRPATVPINLLQELSARADAAACQEQEDPEESNQQVEEDPLELPATETTTGKKPFHISQLPSSQELPSSQWSASPEREQPAAGLPPDSSPPEQSMKPPQHVLPDSSGPVDDADMATSPSPSERAVQVKQTPHPRKAELPRTTVQPNSTYVPSTFPDARKRRLSDSVDQVPLKRARKASSPAEEDITYSQIERSKLQCRRSVLRPLSKDKPSVETWVEQTAQTSREASIELGTPNIDRSSSVSVEEAALNTKPVTKTKITQPSASPFAAPIGSVPTVDDAVIRRLVTESKKRQHQPSASPFAQPKRKQQRTSQEEQTPFKRFVEAFNSLPGKATREGAVNVFAWRSERA